MVESPLRQSALAHLHLAARAVADAGEAGVRLCERPSPGQLNLRGDAADDDFRAAVRAALGFAPPPDPNTSAASGGITALWLGPDEWLVVTPKGREADTARGLRDALAGKFAAVTEVGHARAVIGLSGAHARDVLMKGCSLDLHPRVFGPGRCAQTGLARAQVVLHQTDPLPAFELYVQRSVAEYLWLWLEDAAAEYGFAITEG